MREEFDVNEPYATVILDRVTVQLSESSAELEPTLRISSAKYEKRGVSGEVCVYMYNVNGFVVCV